MKGEGEIKFDKHSNNSHPPKSGSSNMPSTQNEDDLWGKFVDELIQKLKPPATEKSERRKIDELVTKSSRILFKTSGLFPFDFFPDEIAIDENKVSIIRRGLIEENTDSISIKDLGDVTIGDILLFASLTITDNQTKEEFSLQFLDPGEAKRAYNILQGLILGRDQKINWAKIKTDELIKKVEELGQTK